MENGLSNGGETEEDWREEIINMVFLCFFCGIEIVIDVSLEIAIDFVKIEYSCHKIYSL